MRDAPTPRVLLFRLTFMSQSTCVSFSLLLCFGKETLVACLRAWNVRSFFERPCCCQGQAEASNKENKSTHYEGEHNYHKIMVNFLLIFRAKNWYGGSLKEKGRKGALCLFREFVSSRRGKIEEKRRFSSSSSRPVSPPPPPFHPAPSISPPPP